MGLLLLSSGQAAGGDVSGGSNATVHVVPEGTGAKHAYGAAESAVVITPEAAGAEGDRGGSECPVGVRGEGAGVKHARGSSEASVTITAQSPHGGRRGGSGDFEILPPPIEAPTPLDELLGSSWQKHAVGGSMAEVTIVASGRGKKGRRAMRRRQEEEDLILI